MRIVNIYLLKCAFGREPDDIIHDSAAIQFTIEIETHFSNEKSELIVTLTTTTKSEKPFYFSITYSGTFFIESDEMDHIERIGTIHGPAILFPFIREHVADLTRRAGLNAFIINPVNFVALASQSGGKKGLIPSHSATKANER